MSEDRFECHDWGVDGYPGEFVYGDDVYIDDYYMDERWLPDVDCDDYWVSTKGRVWSHLEHKFNSGSPVGELGHIDLSLRIGGCRVHKYLHQMVAEAFIPNPNKLPMVRHLDNDPSNNCVSNLAWGTALDNVRDCIESGRFYYLSSEDRELAMKKRRDPVVAVNLMSGQELKFESQQEASRVLGISQASISNVIHGDISNVKGYYFYRFKDGMNIDLNTYEYSRHGALIRATELATGKKYLFHGQTEAAQRLGMSVASVCNAVNGKTHAAKGYFFEYVNEEDYPDDY